MIKLPDNIHLETGTLNRLKAWQDEIKGDFAEQSRLAKALFRKKNTKRNSTFQQVREKLAEMCPGTRRCVYCEDSAGVEVEHFYPKDLYPDRVFEWENFVLACGSCNRSKSNKFAVFRNDSTTMQRLNPPDWPKGKEPPAGEAVMINPREEDPVQFAVLDLISTFKFVANPNTNNSEKERFNYTYEEVLRLNHQEREFLRQAREEAFYDYKARFLEYDRQKRNDAEQADLENLIANIRKKNHPTVWREMQRWHRQGWLEQVDSELNRLFSQNPEALDW